MRTIRQALAILALLLPVSALHAITPLHGNYSGTSGIYRVTFHFNGAHVTNGHLFVNGVDIPLDHALSAYSPTSHKFHLQGINHSVAGNWEHDGQVKCTIHKSSDKKGTVKPTLTVHHQGS